MEYEIIFKNTDLNSVKITKNMAESLFESLDESSNNLSNFHERSLIRAIDKETNEMLILDRNSIAGVFKF